VSALDKFNNVANAYTGTVQLTTTDPQVPTLTGGTLTNGVGSFLATLKTAGTETITATDSVRQRSSGRGRSP
jgi:hypothetical protein